MRKFITYSYTILLCLTCLIAFPFILVEITSDAKRSQVHREESTLIDSTPQDSQANQSANNTINNVLGEQDKNNNTIEENNANTDELEEDKSKEDNSKEDNPNEDNSKEDNSKENNPNEDNSNKDTINSNDTSNVENQKQNSEKEFIQVTTDYFENALFIGDSRTVGLSEYGNLKKATFLASTGMNVYELLSTKVSIPNIGKVDLIQLLKKEDYGKIYIMLGINELGYDIKSTIKKYSEIVNTIKELQPDALIFLQANLHVTQSRSNSDSVFNNKNLDKLNSKISALADNKTIFYIDVNEIFDDENGNLRSDYSNDNTHVFGKYYADWCDWLHTKAIQK